MITDWIRMRTDIYRDPKVLIIANALARHESVTCHEAVTKFRDIHVTRHAVVGALVTIWGTMRHSGHAEGNDLFCNRINLSILDGICDLPGFGSAMAEAGWAIETDEGVIFPGFFADLNSVPTGKKASTAAERQRRCREKKSVTKCHEMSRDSHTADSHAVTQCHTLEEKRREEKRETKVSRASGDVDGCISHFNAVAERVGWSQVQKITNSRKAALIHRMADCGGADAWCEAMDRAALSPLLTGQTGRGWRADFDWLCKAGNFTKLMEGNYDPRNSDQGQPRPGQGNSMAEVFLAVGAARSRRAGTSGGGGEWPDGSLQ